MKYFILEFFKGSFWIGEKLNEYNSIIRDFEKPPFNSVEEALNYVVENYEHPNPEKSQSLRANTTIFYKKTDNPIEKLEVLQKIDAYFKDLNKEHITPDFDVFGD